MLSRKMKVLETKEDKASILIRKQMKLKFNKKCFRNIYAPLGAKFKITTYMYKAWLQPLHQVWY